MMRANQSRPQPSVVGHVQNANAALAALDRWVVLRGAEPSKRTQSEVVHYLAARELERLAETNLTPEELSALVLLEAKARGEISADTPCSASWRSIAARAPWRPSGPPTSSKRKMIFSPTPSREAKIEG